MVEMDDTEYIEVIRILDDDEDEDEVIDELFI